MYANEEYKYTQDEYLNLLRQSKFGDMFTWIWSRCNREIELMALGTVPIVDKNVDIHNYYDAPIQKVFIILNLILRRNKNIY